MTVAVQVVDGAKQCLFRPFYHHLLDFILRNSPASMLSFTMNLFMAMLTLSGGLHSPENSLALCSSSFPVCSISVEVAL